MMDKLLKKIKRNMVKGHDDFKNYLCIHIDDWDAIVLKELKKGGKE